MIQRAAPDWLKSGTFAHRGLHSAGVPQNSRSAAQAAIAAGIGIECDVQMSSNNVPLVFHDWKLDRLTAESGMVAGRSASELCRIKLNDSNDTIWTLSELLDCVAGRVPILIEVKSLAQFDIAGACTAIKAVTRDYLGPLAVMSFDPRMGEWFAEHAPEFVRGLVATDTLDHGFLSAWRAPFAIDKAQPDFLACDIRDLPNAIAGVWRETGRPLLTWTVHSPVLRARAELHTDAQIAEGGGIE